MFDIQLFLEKAERIDAILGTLDEEAVEGVAFRQTELAADDLVLRQRVAVDVDPLHIDARRVGDAEINPHRQVFLAAVEVRLHIGEGIAEQARRLAERVDRVLDLLGVVPIALLHRQTLSQSIARQVANVRFDLHIAEFVTIAFLHHIGDDEVLLVRRQFGDGGNDAEVGIAFGQVELAQLLLVIGETIGIVAGAGRKDAEPARLLRHHLAAQFTVLELLVADDVDLADLRLGAFRDFEDDVDAVLIELHHLRFDGRGKAALPTIEFDDAGDICAHF